MQVARRYYPGFCHIGIRSLLETGADECPLSAKAAISKIDSTNINHAIEAAWPGAPLLRSWQVLAARLPWT
jgi:hypothetical protein